VFLHGDVFGDETQDGCPDVPRQGERLSGDYLAAFDRALEWAQMGTNADIGDFKSAERPEVKYEELAP
jgi:hypothetical protein